MLKSCLFEENRKNTAVHSLVGHSPLMQEVYQDIERIAKTDTTVLIYGETGTGKELATEAIHRMSSRRHAPFVRGNCAAFSEHLLQSELFGHVKGAFTGAIADRMGRFEAAQGGTLFLDEIGEISPSIQVSLLRVLEQRCVERVGSNTLRPLDVRIITATNKNLLAGVASGCFRTDLYYRLNTVKLMLPPLREHLEDIPVLVEHFIRHFNQSFCREIKGITFAALDELASRPWPGNVRELKNVIEHGFVFCENDVIGINDLGPCEIASPWSSGIERRKNERRSSTHLPNLKNNTPTQLIQNVKLDADSLRKMLEQHHWHLEHTATTLGIHRTTLWRHMQSFGLCKQMQ